MNILSIQSWVAYGHVGNSGAVFPLQRLGAEVWAINTVQFSNHPGYGDWTGRVAEGTEIAALIEGIGRRGVLAECDGVLSGYMGSPAVGDAIVGAVDAVRASGAPVLYCCDPVIGDDEVGVYVRGHIPELIRDAAIPRADIATPNRFELEWLTGQSCATLSGTRRAIEALQARMRPAGPRAVLVTSLRTDATPDGHVDMIAAEAGAAHVLRAPLLPRGFSGAGDVTAALFLFHRYQSRSSAIALERAGSSVAGLLRRTEAAGARELLTVAAQEEFVSPSLRLEAEPI